MASIKVSVSICIDTVIDKIPIRSCMYHLTGELWILLGTGLFQRNLKGIKQQYAALDLAIVSIKIQIFCAVDIKNQVLEHVYYHLLEFE